MAQLISRTPVDNSDQIAVVTTYQGSMSLRIHADGFLELAELGAAHATSIDSITPSIIYAIRHATELFLKYVITELDDQHFKRADDDAHSVKKLFSHYGHWINRLFACCKDDIVHALEFEAEHGEHANFDRRAWLRDFEDIIKQVSDIDPDGQTLRYPTTRAGTPNLGGTMQVSVKQLTVFAGHARTCFSGFANRKT